jgi:flagellar biosynthesis protein FlhG
MTASRGASDQADMLRQLAGSAKLRGCAEGLAPVRENLRVISFTSGKDGVGKSSVVINLAELLAKLGNRVLVVDADPSMGDISLLLGLAPPYTLNQVLSGERRLEEIIVDGGNGVKILPAGIGAQRYQTLSPSERLSLFQGMERLEETFDYVLIDTGAGIPANVTGFASAAREVVLVVTPEPTSITDAYALVKTLSARYEALRFRLLVNKCRDAEEGASLFLKLSTITTRFLEISLVYAGCILHDEMLVESVRRRGALCRLFPNAKAAASFRALAQHITTEGPCDAVITPLDPPAARRKEWRNHELSS